MFAKLLSQLLAPQPAPLPALAGRLALAALLVRIARSDGQYAPAEIQRIDQILCNRYQLPLPEATALRVEAETLEQEAPDTVRFTRALKEAVPHEDRASLLQALWTVALADAGRDPEEDAVIRLTTNLLGLTDHDSALARRRAERAHAGPAA